MPRNPPPEFPVQTYPSPDITDQVLLESVTSELANSSPVAPGTVHENTREFPGFKLGKQVVSPNDHNFTLRFWVKDQPSPDTFSPAWNYAIKYASESDAHPSLIRAYRVPKAGYTPLAKGTALADFPNAVLVSEEPGQFPTDSEFYAIYFSVVRVYETLPGPWVSDTLIDPDGVTVTIKKRRNLNTSITPSESLVSGVWTEVTNTGGDTVVSEETVKSRAIPGNSMTVKKTDPDGIVVSIARTLKAQSAITPSESFNAGVLTKVSQEDPPVFRGFALRSGNLVAWEIVETRALPGNPLTTKKIGTPNPIPERYRGLVRDQETNQSVSADYTFPPGLTGDQNQIELAQQTIAEFRLKIWEQVIAMGADAILSGDSDEYGALAIYETVVNQGTPVDTGFLIKHSEVKAFGGGSPKAAKITVVYTNAQIAGVKVTNGGSGGSNGSHTDGSFTGGGGSGGTFTYVVSGGIVQPSITITAPGSGYTGTVLPTPVFPSGDGAIAGTAYLGTAILSSRPYDEEMMVRYDESRQIVMSGTPDSTPVNLYSEETKALDIWRLLRIITHKVPTADSEGNAIVTYASRPFAFPGLFSLAMVLGFAGVPSPGVVIPFSFRKTRAELVKVKILTWWVTSSGAPDIAVDEVITDSILVYSLGGTIGSDGAWKSYEGVLHDAFISEYNYHFGSINVSDSVYYAATTPSYSEYMSDWLGTERDISVSVTQTKQANLWKVQVEKTTFR
jgi:uncharacterized membrane protein YgcG